MLRPAKLWNDTESAPDADRLVDRLGPPGWADACGSVPVAAFTVTKLAWLRRCEPELFARIGHVMLPHDWLTFRLTGRFVHRSGRRLRAPATGRRPRTGTGSTCSTWSTTGLDWPTDSRRCRTRGTGRTADGQRRPSSGLVPASRSPSGPATTWPEPWGSDSRHGRRRRLVGYVGNGLRLDDRPTRDPTGAVAGFADATDRFLPLVCTLNATLVTEAVGRLLAVDRPASTPWPLRAPAGSGRTGDGPYLAGERTPNRPQATGTLHGIRPDVSPARLARAAFEGVVCGLLDGRRRAAARGVALPSGRMVAARGGARSAAYRDVLASLWPDRPVDHPRAGARCRGRQPRCRPPPSGPRSGSGITNPGRRRRCPRDEPEPSGRSSEVAAADTGGRGRG